MDRPSTEKPGRLGLYGDVWMRFIAWGTRNCPPWIEWLVVSFSACLITFLAGNARRGIAANLRVVLGKKSCLHDWARVFRVFQSFAWTLVDSARVRGGQQHLSWEIVGNVHFEALKNVPGGVVLATAHMGGYDIAAPAFTGRFGRTLHAVRLPERNAALQAYMERTRDTQQDGHFRIHYNIKGEVLGLTLAQALTAGDIVAVQGDRVLAGVSGVPVAVPGMAGVRWQLPRGPFVLAATTRCPVFPMFITRRDWRHYQIEFFPPLPFPSIANAQERRQAPDALLAAWSELLLKVVRQHWSQWVALEAAFEEEPATTCP